MRLHGQQIPLIGFLLVSKQWGIIPATSGSYPTITLLIALQKKYFFAAGKYIDYASASGNEYGYIYNKTLTDFKVVYERGGDMVWFVIGR